MQAIIFDLDGVLCRTDQYHYLAWKALADRLGIPFSPQDNDRLRGVGRMESLGLLLEKSAKSYSVAEKQQFAQEKNRRYQELLAQMTPAAIAPEVRSTLAALRAQGYRLAVGSSSKNAGQILDKTDLRDAFDAVVDGNNIRRAKPDPEVFLRAAKELGVPPAQCAVVEDAYNGILAAKAGGFYTVAVGAATEHLGADAAAEHFGQLPALLSGK
jgi:beta-phosphoglucomutase